MAKWHACRHDTGESCDPESDIEVALGEGREAIRELSSLRRILVLWRNRCNRASELFLFVRPFRECAGARSFDLFPHNVGAFPHDLGRVRC